uniref:Uncharacterized protein n=1 Tax=Arundo donax TaxID=35708 RepID=A0A0A9FQR9_ARUDO
MAAGSGGWQWRCGWRRKEVDIVVPPPEGQGGGVAAQAGRINWLAVEVGDFHIIEKSGNTLSPGPMPKLSIVQLLMVSPRHAG